MIRALLAALVALAGLGACGNAVTAPAAKVAVSAPARGMSLAMELTERGIRVRVEASGSPAEVRAWQLGADVAAIEVLDARGRALPFRREGQRIDVDGGSPTVVVQYDILIADRAFTPGPAIDEDPHATLLEGRRYRAIGGRILALPDAFESKPAPIVFQQRAAAGLVVGSSFGVGRESVKQQLELAGSALRRSVFISGPGGRADLDAPEGHDESAWLGYTAFDPRAVSAEVAGFRGLLHEYFKDIELPPATLFFAVDARPRGHFRVLRTHSGVLVTLSGLDPYDTALRLAVAHELVHAWIGERIWVGDPSAGHEADSYWFHEGVTRWVAREQLARVGLLSSDELAGEVDRLLAVVTTSRHAARSWQELVDSRAAPGVVTLMVARGALFATAADAQIREASHGARSFDDVLRALAARATEHRGPLPADAVSELVAKELGAARARDTFEDYVVTGKRKKLPEAALGPCFEASEVGYEIYEPGFDVAASRTARAVVGLDAKGPAAAAGLREGDELTTAEVPDRADQRATITAIREGKPVVISYRPFAGSRRGQAFRRKAALGEEACRKLALRR